MANSTINAQRLRELLHYDEGTGVFTWRVSRGASTAGNVAGRVNVDGYVQIGIDGMRYHAHRLAWLYVHGNMPVDEIDHLNRVRSDNRLANLREASGSENKQNMLMQRNNTSGYKGVCWVKRRNRWQAQIKIKNKHRYLGQFDTAEEAHAAYLAAAAELHTRNPSVMVWPHRSVA